MRNLLAYLALFSAVVLTACGPEGNKDVSLEIDGPCLGCGEARLDSLLKSLDAVAEHTFNPNEGLLSVSFDSTKINVQELERFLNENGYDVGEKLALSYRFACCDVDDDALGDIEDILNEDEEMLKELDDELSSLDDDEELDVDLDEADKAIEEDGLDDLMQDDLLDEDDLNVE